jgi:hypothetical protein
MQTARASFLVALVFVAVARPQSSSGESAILRNWSGDSICTQADSGCHNEKVIWRVAKLADKPGWYAIRGDKIENGKAVSMGTLEFQWDADTHTIACTIPQGTWRLTLAGTTLEGTLKRPDDRLFRKVILRKSEQ